MGKFWPWIPIQFGYTIWPSSNEGINVRYWETYQIAFPIVECLDPCHSSRILDPVLEGFRPTRNVDGRSFRADWSDPWRHQVNLYMSCMNVVIYSFKMLLI